jgi:hypothetical protein
MFSALGAGLAAQLAKYAIEPHIQLDTFVGIFSQLLASGAVGAGAYLAFSHFLKLEEFSSVKKFLTGRVFRFRQTIPEDPTQASGI